MISLKFFVIMHNSITSEMVINMVLKYTKHPYVEIIKKISSMHPSYSAKQIINSVGEDLYTNLISDNDRRLLQLAFQPKLTQENLDEFLKQWDIEAAGADRAAILAYTMKLHPELKFNNYTGPRLKGLLNYLRFQNLELISHFSRIVHRLNQKRITPILIKGGAMRYLRSDLPRVMGDIDILVHSEDELTTAQKLVKEMGYIYTDAGHSFDVHTKDNVEKGILDIHRFFSFLPELNERFNKALFSRIEKKRIFSVDAYLPCKEDMFFICLNNLTVNLRSGACIRGIAYNLFDLEYLINSKEDFNWDIVAQNILMTHTEATTYFAMQFVNQVLPDIIPNKILLNSRLNNEVEKLINHDKFYALYVHDVKYACKKLKLKKAIRHWTTFKEYLRLEGQHFFTKRILKHPFLIRYFFKYFGKSKNAN